jgi:hypothetical protein
MQACRFRQIDAGQLRARRIAGAAARAIGERFESTGDRMEAFLEQRTIGTSKLPGFLGKLPGWCRGFACGAFLCWTFASGAAEPVHFHEVHPDCGRHASVKLLIAGEQHMNLAQLHAMECAYFAVYPKLRARFHPQAPATVYFVFEDTPEHLLPAWSAGDKVYFAVAYWLQNTKDSNVVVHELTHIVLKDMQARPPLWLQESIADWVRAEYGIADTGDGWALPAGYQYGQTYWFAYRQGARFLQWIDQNYHQGPGSIVDILVAMAFDGSYSEQVWPALTGLDLDALWLRYGEGKAPVPATSGVTVFGATQFGGRGVMLDKGRYDLLDLYARGIPGAWIQSMKIPQGYRVTLYVDTGFKGGFLYFDRDTADLGPLMNAHAVSVVVE